MLSGYKTYICAAALALITGLHAAGIINDSLASLLTNLVGAGGLAALRAAVSTKGDA